MFFFSERRFIAILIYSTFLSKILKKRNGILRANINKEKEKKSKRIKRGANVEHPLWKDEISDAKEPGNESAI